MRRQDNFSPTEAKKLLIYNLLKSTQNQTLRQIIIRPVRTVLGLIWLIKGELFCAWLFLVRQFNYRTGLTSFNVKWIKQAGAELGHAQYLLSWAWVYINDKSLKLLSKRCWPSFPSEVVEKGCEWLEILSKMTVQINLCLIVLRLVA